MTPAFKNVTITLAKAGKFEEGSYSYITPDGVRELYKNLAATSPNLMPHLAINRNGRKVGHIISVRLVEHENGCFIEGDAVITDEQTVGIPASHLGQIVRQSLVDDGYKFASDEPLSIGVKP